MDKTIASWLGAALCAVLLTGPAAAKGEDCDSHERCSHHPPPLVFSVENTGAHFPAPDFPPFAQLPIIRPLPNPFASFGRGLFEDGFRGASAAGWERRRNEIKAAIEKYEIGPKPDCSDCTITASYTPAAAGSNSGALMVVVTRNGKSVTLNERVFIPQGMGNGPFPAVIAMSLAFPPFFVPPVPNYGSLPASVFANLPVATIDFFHNDVTQYSFSGVIDHTKDPFYQLYPELCAGVCTGTSNSGQYAAWAWGVSRLIDGIEIASHQAVNPLPIDVQHLAVTGCSYAGKMALFAGAFDERVALTIAQENGGGGAPAWRVSHQIEAQGSVEDVDDTDYNWFAGQMKQFAGENVYKLPVDHHELMAMVAPRALLETGNTDFYWLSNRSNYISARATQEIYSTLGIEDRYGFYIDGGHNHCATLPAEAPAVSAFVGRFLLGQAVSSDVQVNPYPTLDYKRWTWWWKEGPFGEPRFPNDWNSNGTVVMSLDRIFRPLWVSGGDTVQAGYQLALGGQHPDATVGVTGAYVETDVKCFDGTSYTLSIPMPAGQTYPVPANSSHFVPGPGIFQASTTAAACGGAAPRGLITGAYFSSLGVANGVGNPPKGNGFTMTDTTDPLKVTFSCTANGIPSGFAPPVTVNFGQ